MGWRGRVERQRLIPLSCRVDLPVCGKSAVAQFYPGCSDGIGKHKRTTLYCNRVVKPSGNTRSEWEIDLNVIVGFPFSLNARKSATRGRWLYFSVHPNCRVSRPLGDSTEQWKLYRRSRINSQADRASEWIVRFLCHLNRRIVNFRTNLAGRIGSRHQAIVRRHHEQIRRKLRPALMVICGAATKIWFEPEQIRLRAIGGPWFLVQAAFDLIRLLVVLMGPHIVSRRSG